MPFHSCIQEEPGWETLGETRAFADPHVEVSVAKVRTPSRPAGVSWTVVHRKAACVVVPRTAEGRFVLIRQERVPVRSALWEFPAGQIDHPGCPGEELLKETALRELAEESGYRLDPEEGELLSLGFFFPSVGMSDEICYLYLARPVAPGGDGPAHQDGEAITGCREVSPLELQAMIATGEICDANTLAAFARMSAAGLV